MLKTISFKRLCTNVISSSIIYIFYETISEIDINNSKFNISPGLDRSTPLNIHQVCRACLDTSIDALFSNDTRHRDAIFFGSSHVFQLLFIPHYLTKEQTTLCLRTICFITPWRWLSERFEWMETPRPWWGHIYFKLIVMFFFLFTLVHWTMKTESQRWLLKGTPRWNKFCWRKIISRKYQLSKSYAL